MFMDSIRALLGESMYESTLQMRQVMEGLWSSLLIWRVLALVLFIGLVSKICRRRA
jgi:hypothetical protein